jgi:hypothetical protein
MGTGCSEEDNVVAVDVIQTPPSQEFMDAICCCGVSVQTCDFCGRTHFGGVDLSETEREAFRTEAVENPGMYIDHGEDGVGCGELDGKMVVYDCPCNKVVKYERFVWTHRYVILKYLRSRLDMDRVEVSHLADAMGQVNG